MDADEVRRIAAGLPGITDSSNADWLGFGFGDKGIAWTFMQRDHPKQKRWPNIEVLAISCPLERKELLIEAAPDRFFHDPHYRGYPAVLVRLPLIDAAELTELLEAACVWAASRPKRRTRK